MSVNSSPGSGSGIVIVDAVDPFVAPYRDALAPFGQVEKPRIEPELPTEHVVERAVLQHEHDDVIDERETRRRRSHGTGAYIRSVMGTA